MFKGRVLGKVATPMELGTIDRRVSVTREMVPYEPLLVENLGTCSRYVTDVDLLFNQERLDRMSLASLRTKLDERVQSGDTGLAELRKNIGDEQLSQFIKSRYIQSLSELRSWTSYLSEKYESTEQGIRNYIAALQEQQRKKENPDKKDSPAE